MSTALVPLFVCLSVPPSSTFLGADSSIPRERHERRPAHTATLAANHREGVAQPTTVHRGSPMLHRDALAVSQHGMAGGARYRAITGEAE